MSDIAFWVVMAVFIVTLTVIMFEKVNETAATLFAMSVCGIAVVLDGVPNPLTGEPLTFPSFIALIEWDTILFIASMMMVVSISASSGMFQYISLILAQRTGGEPKKIFRTFILFVYGLSLFLDPLPTILVMAPFTIQVCRALEMDFRPLLISEVIVANIASFPVVVASVPNLLIVSWADIPAIDLLMLLPLSLMLVLVTLPIFMRIYGERLSDNKYHDPSLLMMIQPVTMIRSRRDFYVSVFGLAVLIMGFVLRPEDVALTSIMVASLLLAFSHERAKQLLKELSWDTVFFLIGLFGIVNALEVVGVISAASAAMVSIVGTNPFIGVLIMIWIPGAVLAVIDNIPVAAFLAPMAVDLGQVSRAVPISLIVGANVGGYFIPFGDAPNMIVVAESAANGRPLSFAEFTKVAVPLGTLHLVLSTLYCSLLVLLI
jgi:Na+/H+ antiporter NhaD/arsenite permease-like protein